LDAKISGGVSNGGSTMSAAAPGDLSLVAEPDMIAIAQWMRERLQQNGYLYQSEVLTKFGGKYMSPDPKSGNWRIVRPLLDKFTELTSDACHLVQERVPVAETGAVGSAWLI